MVCLINIYLKMDILLFLLHSGKSCFNKCGRKSGKGDNFYGKDAVCCRKYYLTYIKGCGSDEADKPCLGRYCCTKRGNQSFTYFVLYV